jgi:2'-5' RNA ligase
MTKKLRVNIRRQVTLFISENDYSEIEKCRKKFNSKQYRLIKYHITLCREDEIEEFEKIAENLKKINFKSFVLNFGKPIQFSVT